MWNVVLYWMITKDLRSLDTPTIIMSVPGLTVTGSPNPHNYTVRFKFPISAEEMRHFLGPFLCFHMCLNHKASLLCPRFGWICGFLGSRRGYWFPPSLPPISSHLLPSAKWKRIISLPCYSSPTTTCVHSRASFLDVTHKDVWELSFTSFTTAARPSLLPDRLCMSFSLDIHDPGPRDTLSCACTVKYYTHFKARLKYHLFSESIYSTPATINCSFLCVHIALCIYHGYGTCQVRLHLFRAHS